MKRKSIKDNKIKDLLSDQKGIALLTTLIFIFILVTFAVALLVMTSNDIRLSVIQRDSTKAFYVAESGIEKALWNLNTSVLRGGEGFDWRGTFNEGTTAEYYDVTVVTIQDETPILPEIIKISSTGVIKPIGVKNLRKRRIEVKAKKGVLPSDNLSYKYAIATESSMEITGNFSIVGNIHSNGDIGVAGEAYYLDGDATAYGENPISGVSGIYDPLPKVDYDFYEKLSKDSIYGGKFYDIDGGTKYFDTDDQVIKGIHFIVGNVEISANTLFIEGGAIFATGTIISGGNAQIKHTRRTENIYTGIDCTCVEDCTCLDNLGDPCYSSSFEPDSENYDPLCNNPFALVANGNIVLSGTVDAQGIIQTNSEIIYKGVVTVDPGAILAEDGIFRGGGGEEVMNVVYDESLIGTTVPGTGLPFFIKISWQEK